MSDCRDIVGNLTELESEVSSFQPGIKEIFEHVALIVMKKKVRLE